MSYIGLSYGSLTANQAKVNQLSNPFLLKIVFNIRQNCILGIIGRIYKDFTYLPFLILVLLLSVVWHFNEYLFYKHGACLDRSKTWCRSWSRSTRMDWSYHWREISGCSLRRCIEKWCHSVQVYFNFFVCFHRINHISLLH
jgi:hypothetical protein